MSKLIFAMVLVGSFGSTAFAGGHEAVNVGDVLNQSIQEKQANEQAYRANPEAERPDQTSHERLSVDDDAAPAIHDQANSFDGNSAQGAN